MPLKYFFLGSRLNTFPTKPHRPAHYLRMAIIIRTRFGSRNFIQYLHLKDVCIVKTTLKRQQQVYIKHSSSCILPQSVNNAVYNMQQVESV